MAVHSHLCVAQRAGSCQGLGLGFLSISTASTTSIPLPLQRKALASLSHSCLDQQHLKLRRESHEHVSSTSGRWQEPSPSSNLCGLWERAGREETASSATPLLLYSSCLCSSSELLCNFTDISEAIECWTSISLHPDRSDKWFVGRKKLVWSNSAITPDHEGQTQLAGCKTGSPKGDATLNVRSCNPQDWPS